MKKNKKQLRRTLFAGLYSLLGFVLLTIILLATAPQFMLNTFGFRAYVAHYDQMEPTIANQSLVFITRQDAADLNPLDLATFQSNADLNNDGQNDLITSYFNRVEGTSYYFRSEGATNDWAVVPASGVVGGYGFSIPVLGLIVDFIGSPFGIAVVFVNIAIIAGIVFVIKSGKKEPKEIKIES